MSLNKIIDKTTMSYNKHQNLKLCIQKGEIQT